MSYGSDLSHLHTAAESRLTDPRVVGLQLVVVIASGLIRWVGVSPAHPVLALVAVPGLAVLTGVLLVSLIQEVTLRVEEKPHESDEIHPLWLSVVDRALVLVNAAIVVPLLLWGVPVFGAVGYTAEALAEPLFSEPITADHGLSGVIIAGLILLGSTWTALGVIVSAQAYLGPDLARDRMTMYLGLRSSLPSRGSESIAPLVDGGEYQMSTERLADACVRFSLTRLVPEDLPEPVDIKRLVDEIEPIPASSPVLFAFLLTLNTRFLSVLLGGMLLIIAWSFGLTIESVSTLTLIVGTGFGSLSQIVYTHSFVAPTRDVFNK